MRRLIMEPTNGFTERTELTNGLTRDAAELAKTKRTLREAQFALGELRELMKRPASGEPTWGVGVVQACDASRRESDPGPV
jgi:hypothetical protein